MTSKYFMAGCIAFSPDGKCVATASMDRTGKIWDAVTGRELLTLKGHTAYLRSIAFSADVKRVATASEDKTVKVWDAETGCELLTLKGHSGPVEFLTFLSDGKHLATGGKFSLAIRGTFSQSEIYCVKVWNALDWTKPFDTAEKEFQALKLIRWHATQERAEKEGALNSQEITANSVQRKSAEADASFKARNWGKAVADLSAVLEEMPDDANLYLKRALLLERRAIEAHGDLDRAIADCMKALELKPGFLPAYERRFWAYIKKGDIARAEGDIAAALAIDPQARWTLVARAFCLTRKGDFAGGLAGFDEVVKAHPDDPFVYYCLAWDFFAHAGLLSTSIRLFGTATTTDGNS